MILVGPQIPQGVTTDAFVYLSDIAPTIYDYLHIKQPKTVEGLSMMPLINQKKKQHT